MYMNANASRAYLTEGLLSQLLQAEGHSLGYNEIIEGFGIKSDKALTLCDLFEVFNLLQRYGLLEVQPFYSTARLPKNKIEVIETLLLSDSGDKSDE